MTRTGELVSKLYIANDWAGEAYFLAAKADGDGYARGETLEDTIAAVGSMNEQGELVKGGTFSGKLWYSPANNMPTVGVDGNV